jgi:hypothetical protein
MSRGQGTVQRRLLAALKNEPNRTFTIEELAAVGYSECGSQELSVRRALKTLLGPGAAGAARGTDRGLRSCYGPARIS